MKFVQNTGMFLSLSEAWLLRFYLIAGQVSLDIVSRVNIIVCLFISDDLLLILRNVDVKSF